MDNKIDEVISELPMFDTVIQEIMAVINDERTTASKLEKIIQKDPVLSLKMIKLANSTFFSPVRPITTIAHAIRFIGFSTLKSLVYSIALQSIGKKGSVVPQEIKKIQQKCLVNGIVAMMLGRAYLKNNRLAYTVDTFYTLGLFHDIGFLVLANYDMEKIYRPMLNKIKDGISLAEAEGQLSHSRIGAELMRKWQIPEIYSEFTLNHNSTKFEVSNKLYILHRIIQIADSISAVLEYDDFASKEIDLKKELAELEISEDDFFDENGEIEPIREFIDNMLSGFAI